MIKQWNYLGILLKKRHIQKDDSASRLRLRYPHRLPERCPALVHGGAFFCWDAADEHARPEALHIDPWKLDQVGRVLMVVHPMSFGDEQWKMYHWVHQGASGLDFMLLHIYM